MRVIFKIVLIVISVFFIETKNSEGSMEEIKGFDLSSCQIEFCIHLTSQKAERGDLDNIYILSEARLVKVVNVKNFSGTKVDFRYESLTGYYDPIYQRVVLSKITNDDVKELVLNIKTGRLIKF